MPNLRKMNAGEFARRLRSDSSMPDKRFAFFIGAGCSVSSGIPSASSLVRDHWLPKLQEVCAPDPNDFTNWLKNEIPDYDSKNPAASYGAVIEKLFLHPEDRQREIERLCDGKFPGFGYAVLATLISQNSGSFNVIVTTNFDDLVSDALYLFTPSRPLVIGHELLAGYIRPTRTRPLVVKIHGDARLSPQNTATETANIQKEIERQVNALLHDRVLIFMGYGGNDDGIAKMFNDLPKEALPFGIYWVSGSEPQGVLRPWLEQRNAIWVEKFDFDETMLLIRDSFDLPHPNIKQVEEVFSLYGETYKNLSGRIRSLPAKTSDEELKKALERADSGITGWLQYTLSAERIKNKNPDEADKIYQKGIEQFPQSSTLLGNYATFLHVIRKEHDNAEQYYLRALEVDPNSASLLGNYANFLNNIRKDNDKAEQYYLRALKSGPNHANILGNYANFLKNIRKEYDKAEEYYLRALEVDPNHAGHLGNYVGYLLAIGNREKGYQFLDKAIQLLTMVNIQELEVEVWFYAFCHWPISKQSEALKELKKVLINGYRSLGWDLSMNIEQAKKDGHPDIKWLEVLADVITKDADIRKLDKWDKWKEI